MVAMPMVMEHGGTGSPVPKLSVISSRDTESISMMREVDVGPEPGSFVAMLPILPMPSSITSMPPKVAIRLS